MFPDPQGLAASRRWPDRDLKPAAPFAQGGLDGFDLAAVQQIAKPPDRFSSVTSRLASSALEVPPATITSCRASFAAVRAGTAITARPRAGDGDGNLLPASV